MLVIRKHNALGIGAHALATIILLSQLLDALGAGSGGQLNENSNRIIKPSNDDNKVDQLLKLLGDGKGSENGSPRPLIDVIDERVDEPLDEDDEDSRQQNELDRRERKLTNLLALQLARLKELKRRDSPGLPLAAGASLPPKPVILLASNKPANNKPESPTAAGIDLGFNLHPHIGYLTNESDSGGLLEPPENDEVSFESELARQAPAGSGKSAVSLESKQIEPSFLLDTTSNSLSFDSQASSGGLDETTSNSNETNTNDLLIEGAEQAMGEPTGDIGELVSTNVDCSDLDDGLLNPDQVDDMNEVALSQLRFSGNRNELKYCLAKRYEKIKLITKIITPILFSLIILVGLIGNIAVIIVILEDRKMERELSPPNLLILDLSFADLSFIIFCIPFTGWDYAVGHWVFGPNWCKLNQYLIVVCALSSIYTLVLMSIDRFLAVVFPIQCLRIRTSRNTFYAIFLKWIIILLISAPAWQMHGLIDHGKLGLQCRFLMDDYDALQFQIVFFSTSYLFPLCLIFVLYMGLLKKLWCGTRPQGHRESTKMLESKKKVTWLVAGIVIVFAICWCPIQIMLILMRLRLYDITVTYITLQVFAHILGYMNSCVNPIVYAFASENFNNSFKRSRLSQYFRALTPCLKHQPVQETNNNNNNNHVVSSHADHHYAGSRNNHTVTLDHNRGLTH